ncbi:MULTISPECIES: hypothetical protein [unclassified Streptomyces]|uniref:hypothetical protein n=1 Tax=unclassified Streptomyces TaxID=2593676 RepID=UPI00068FD787|nr:MULTISPECIES: hypothetical protein [unclassified Streptomyces]
MRTIHPTAPVVAGLTTVIDAPLATAWELRTDVDNWPVWNAGIDRARPDGPWAARTSCVPMKRIVWGGTVEGIVGVHVGAFEQSDAGVVVRTEESWSGEPVDAAVDELTAALLGSLQSRLG